MKKYIRRDFIKTAGIAAIGAGSLSLAGCETKTENSPVKNSVNLGLFNNSSSLTFVSCSTKIV